MCKQTRDREITLICPNVRTAFVDESSQVHYWLLRKPVDGVEVPKLNRMRVMAGTVISRIYAKVLATRSGIGLRCADPNSR